MLKPSRRIEIMTDASGLDEVVAIIEKAGITAYAVLPEVAGRGGRALDESDAMPGVSKSSYVMAACPPDNAERLIEAIRPLLKRLGGVALAWDCFILQ